MSRRYSTLNQKGFTILELMVATLIFSVILLLCAFGLMQIGRTYYRGITASRTQAVARAISDDIVQAIQYGGNEVHATPTATPVGQSNPSPTPGSTPPSLTTVTIGDRQYEYRLGVMLVSKDQPQSEAQAHEVLKVSKINSDGTLGPGRELLNTRMWLSKFEVIPDGGLWKIDIQVVSGDQDQVIDGDGRAFGNSNFDISRMSCRPGAGSQFCALSGLHTTATRRL